MVNKKEHEHRTNAKLEVWYDGWCPMCSGIKQRLEKLDWLHKLQFRSIRDQDALLQSKLQHVPLLVLEQRMHVQYRSNGRVRSGIEAIESIASYIPLLWITWPFIFMSRKVGLGQRLYDYIAARRIIVPTGACTDDSCEWKPAERKS